MKYEIKIPRLSVLTGIALSVSASAAVNIDWITVEDAGNAPASNGYGSVGYDYKISKFEVNRYTINVANSLGGLSISLADMTSYGGNGTNRPATGVSWNEAARFVNWLNISNGYSAAYKFLTQPGQAGYSSNENAMQWLPEDTGYNPLNPSRNANAIYVLPTINEWFKAAYYSPDDLGYFEYPTGSDDAPTPTFGGTTPGTAVYVGGAPNGGTPSINVTGPSDVTTAGGLSPYGTMGQGGNVWEHSEDNYYLGGSWWNLGGNLMNSWTKSESPPTNQSYQFGFRIASVPEPSTGVLTIIFGVSLLSRRKR